MQQQENVLWKLATALQIKIISDRNDLDLHFFVLARFVRKMVSILSDLALFRADDRHDELAVDLDRTVFLGAKRIFENAGFRAAILTVQHQHQHFT